MCLSSAETDEDRFAVIMTAVYGLVMRKSSYEVWGHVACYGPIFSSHL